ncbi:MAG TPA: glycosyltransferase family 39 protein [Polyangiaceae bacterium]|nr:glycosyltransferase family 39 protein [Polyangiaceae bacterium]
MMSKEKTYGVLSAGIASSGRRRPAAEREELRRIVRSELITISTVVAIFVMALQMDKFYPLKHWLVWHYLGAWAVAGVFSLVCLAAGLPIVLRIRGYAFRTAETLLLGHAVGVVVFFLLMFVLGMAKAFYWPVFFAVPALMLAFGARFGSNYVVRTVRTLLRAAPRIKGPGIPQLAIWMFAGFALLVLYSQILSPDQVSYDARWYHLGIAEEYIAEHGIHRFDDGSYVGAYPQLASVLFAWIYLAPFGTFFDKVECIVHLEFVLFLWTMLGVGLVAERLVRSRLRGAFASIFLFPGIYVYDSGLHGGSDHVIAFFAPAFALTCLAVVRSNRLSDWGLLGAVAAGAALTKYNAILLLPFAGLALLARPVWETYRELNTLSKGAPFAAWRASMLSALRAWSGPALAALVLLTLTAPHWLKNWVYYSNPVFPYLSRLFRYQPWEALNRDIYVQTMATTPWAPHGTAGSRVAETLNGVLNFAFVPHDWPTFHGQVPVFGFLFTLSLVILPFVSAPLRIWTLFVAVHGGVFLWYSTQHMDRYLHVLVPWMASGSAAVLALAWRKSVAGKLPIACLVALQIVWGLDTPTLPGHAMLGKSPTLAAIELGARGYLKEYEQRFDIFNPYTKLEKHLAPDGRVLLHEHHLRAGLMRAVISDDTHTEGWIAYGGFDSRHAIYEKMRGLGVTDVIWSSSSWGWAGHAGDLVFFDFVRAHTQSPATEGGFFVARLNDAPELDLSRAKVAYFACQTGFEQGLYALKALDFPDQVLDVTTRPPVPEVRLGAPEDALELASRARYLVSNPKCSPTLDEAVTKDFERAAHREEIELWIRNRDQLTR